MSLWTLYDNLKEFDFSLGEHYVFVCEYDLRDEADLDLLDSDSADAAACVKTLGLNYNINSRHYSTVLDGDSITDMVSVEWEFYKNG